ncbi:MAG TPA: translation initiation factor IF-3 [Candidatus Angelobacter sp.]|nr:translation initiation factor IF-3 [Candidatus Angelobacter sp.]
MSKLIRINQEIRAEQLRVIGPSGDQLGIMSRSEALQIAKDAEVDLIEISPNANPPVAKVVDWGKYQYQKMKEQQKNKKHAKAVELKQMRMGLKIGLNDLEIKLRKIRDFLHVGHKVKILIFFRGREMAHQELGYEMIDRIVSKLEEDAIVEQKPLMTGRNLSIVIRSK